MVLGRCAYFCVAHVWANQGWWWWGGGGVCGLEGPAFQSGFVLMGKLKNDKGAKDPSC